MKQCASAVLMIRPDCFAYNPETAVSNVFQQKGKTAAEAITEEALQEFYTLADALQKAGIEVVVENDISPPLTPDAIFPNNWVMFHHTGDISLFPMAAPSRRKERRKDVIERLGKRYRIEKIWDYSIYEKEDVFLEGTGSMVFDHVNRIAYACLSPRTQYDLFYTFCGDHQYEPVPFSAFDKLNREIYHTNVMMCIGKRVAVICSESIPEAQRENVLSRLRLSEREIVEISLDQVNKFAGNMLQLTSTSGNELFVMSTQAYLSLHPGQVQVIEKHAAIVHSPLNTIEYNGGGSVRCMLAEIFLPALDPDM